MLDKNESDFWNIKYRMLYSKLPKKNKVIRGDDLSNIFKYK